MHGYFITGTDTGVGKTIASAILTFILKAAYWKPIQSGIADEPSDHETVQKLTGLSAEHFFESTYSFEASLSPDQAAEKEGRTIDLEKCVLPTTQLPLIVEGAGGIYVPLTPKHNMLDLMKQLGFPVIIVARGTLGTINHTLLTIEGLRNQEISIHGVIFSGELNPANQHAIERWGKVKTLFHIPHFNKIDAENIQRWVYAYTFGT